MTMPEENFFQSLSFEPLSRSNWGEFELLFGEKGACGNCWCMNFRLPKKEFESGKLNRGNKDAMKSLVWSGKPTGILAFHKGKAIAWAAFAPREDFLKLEKSRIHKRIDNKLVWSVPCTFIAKEYRRLGLSVLLLKGLIKYARKQAIQVIEAYPTIPTTEKLPDAFLWVGLYKTFERAGFQIVDQTSKNRPMVRLEIRA